MTQSNPIPTASLPPLTQAQATTLEQLLTSQASWALSAGGGLLVAHHVLSTSTDTMLLIYAAGFLKLLIGDLTDIAAQKGWIK